MKHLRLVAFVVFAICAFCLPAQAQKKWTYKGDNGTDGENRQAITIIITKRPNGYEVSGEFIGGDYQFTCNISSGRSATERYVRA